MMRERLDETMARRLVFEALVVPVELHDDGALPRMVDAPSRIQMGPGRPWRSCQRSMTSSRQPDRDGKGSDHGSRPGAWMVGNGSPACRN